MKKLSVLLTVLMLCGATMLFAEEKKGGVRVRPAVAHEQLDLKAYDTNQDGKLDAAELKAMVDAQTARIEKAYENMVKMAKVRHDRELEKLNKLAEKLTQDGSIENATRKAAATEAPKAATAPKAAAEKK